MKFEISGLCNALMDVLVHVDNDNIVETLNLRKSVMHLVDSAEWSRVFAGLEAYPHETHPGGSCANVISTTAMLGADTAFCGQVGDDHFGKIYAESLQKICGQEFLHKLKGAHTGKCLSIITPDAERTMVVSLGCAIELDSDNVFYDVISNSKIFHMTGYAFTGGKMADSAWIALKHAKAHGITISFDVADTWIIETYRDAIWNIIENYADIVFTNESEAFSLCNETPENAIAMLAEKSKIAVVKLGKKGSLIRSNEHAFGIDALSVKAIDTTGAGDSYAGAFLHGLVKGFSLERAGRLASHVAAYAVMQTGAVVTDKARLHALVTDI